MTETADRKRWDLGMGKEWTRVIHPHHSIYSCSDEASTFYSISRDTGDLRGVHILPGSTYQPHINISIAGNRATLGYYYVRGKRCIITSRWAFGVGT